MSWKLILVFFFFIAQLTGSLLSYTEVHNENQGYITSVYMCLRDTNWPLGAAVNQNFFSPSDFDSPFLQPCFTYFTLSFFLLLLKDMTARDLLQQRYTLPNGDTAWRPSPLVTAALEGKLLLLDGIHRVNLGTLAVLSRYGSPLIHYFWRTSVSPTLLVWMLARLVFKVTSRQGAGSVRRHPTSEVGQVPETEGRTEVDRWRA